MTKLVVSSVFLWLQEKMTKNYLHHRALVELNMMQTALSSYQPRALLTMLWKISVNFGCYPAIRLK